MSNLSFPSNVTSSPLKDCGPFLTTGNKVGLTLVYVFVLLAAIIGNTFVIHIVRTQKKMKVSFNYLVVNMAVADLLNAVVAMSINISYVYNYNRWISGILGIILCKSSNFLIVVAVFVSLATLTVITVERYLATTRVLKRPLSVKSVKRLIGGVWVGTAVLSVHELLKLELQEVEGVTYCSLSYVWSKRMIIEYVVKFVVAYAFPLLTMIILYSLIICLLWKKETIGEEIDEYNRRFLKQKKGVIIKLIIIVTIFAFCWLPVHINHLMAAFNYTLFHCVPTWVVLLLYLLAHLNSAINPFLYLMLTKNSRALFKAHISGIIRGDGSSGKGSDRHAKKANNSALFFKRGTSKKATKSLII